LLTVAHRRAAKAAAENACHLAGWDEPPVRDVGARYDLVVVLVKIDDERGVSAAQVSLASSMYQPRSPR
jgi:hypothetical protein